MVDLIVVLIIWLQLLLLLLLPILLDMELELGRGGGLTLVLGGGGLVLLDDLHLLHTIFKLVLLVLGGEGCEELGVVRQRLVLGVILGQRDEVFFVVLHHL